MVKQNWLLFCVLFTQTVKGMEAPPGEPSAQRDLPSYSISPMPINTVNTLAFNVDPKLLIKEAVQASVMFVERLEALCHTSESRKFLLETLVNQFLSIADILQEMEISTKEKITALDIQTTEQRIKNAFGFPLMVIASEIVMQEAELQPLVHYVAEVHYYLTMRVDPGQKLSMLCETIKKAHNWLCNKLFSIKNKELAVTLLEQDKLELITKHYTPALSEQFKILEQAINHVTTLLSTPNGQPLVPNSFLVQPFENLLQQLLVALNR